MQFENVEILSIVHVDPPHRISSSEIESQLEPTMSRLGMQPGLLEGLSGIVARRFWDEGVQPSDVATEAARKAIAAAEIDPKQLGILINTSVCRDYIEPSTACLVHGNLALPETCMNFDLGNACLGFINGMDMVGNMIERGQVDYGIVVDGEGSRFVIEKTIERLLDPSVDELTFRASFATLTLGSGAAAMVLGRKGNGADGHRFLGGVNLAATQHSRLCYGQVDHMVTNTKELMIGGLELVGRTWRKVEQELGWSPDSFQHYVYHQVSRVHTEKSAAVVGVDLERIYRLYPEFGNIGPASVPIVLSKILENGSLQKGHRVALMGIGSGLNCTMAEVAW